MRHLPPAPWRLSAAVLFCLASAFAQNVTLTLTSAGNPNAYNPFAGVMVSPYTLHDSTNGFDISAFCTTFSREVAVGQTWKADVTTLEDPMHSGNINYWAQAYLAFQIHNTSDLYTKALLSFALWGVSEWDGPNGVSAHLGAGAVRNSVSVLIENAMNVTSYDFTAADVTIYTPVGCPSVSAPGACGDTPQYFMSVRTPEPPALSLLGFDLMALVAVVGLVFRVRKSMALGLFVSPKRGN